MDQSDLAWRMSNSSLGMAVTSLKHEKTNNLAVFEHLYKILISTNKSHICASKEKEQEWPAI
jgi:hypothetical protein